MISLGASYIGKFRRHAIKVTMKDVATACGVSQASVSHAYNNPKKISEKQRKKILATAKKLGYTGPNPAASSLRRGQKKSVGAVGVMLNEQLTFAFEDPGTIQLLRGFGTVGNLAAVSVNILPFPGQFSLGLIGDETESKRPSPADMVRHAHVDGFIAYFLPDDHEAIETILSRNLPLVTIDTPRIEGISWVGIDDNKAAEEAAKHILELGHRKVAILIDRFSPDGQRGFASQERIDTAKDSIARERIIGCARAFDKAGVPFSQVPIFEVGGYLRSQALAAASDLLDLYKPTAVIVSSDVAALALLQELKNRNISVPEEVSVIGFDDVPEAESAGLTTISQPEFEKGRIAAELIVKAVKGDPPENVLLPSPLVVRTSTAKPIQNK